MLTPSDIEAKTFHNSLRGYDMNEVDDFLDEIVATVRELTEKLETAAYTSTVATTSDESAVGRALVTAQATADRVIAEANAEAAKILELAKSEAEDWLAEREEKKAAALAEMADFSARVRAVRERLVELADTVAVSLDAMDEAIVSGPAAETEAADDDDDEEGDVALTAEDEGRPVAADDADDEGDAERGDEDGEDQDPWSEPFGRSGLEGEG